eukprot:3514039-Amphidinium_carterae.1
MYKEQPEEPAEPEPPVVHQKYFKSRGWLLERLVRHVPSKSTTAAALQVFTCFQSVLMKNHASWHQVFSNHIAGES